MADSNVVLEDSLKFREGKKWKTRYCMIKKLSPVADRLHLSLYKDQHDGERNQHEKTNVPLEDFFGIDSCFSLDKEQHVMGIVCRPEVILLAFPTREILIDWEITIRAHLGEEKQYPLKLVKAPPNSRLDLGPVKLVIQSQRLCLTTSVPGLPPSILSSWQTSDLRRYGVIDGKFCFEAGTRCGRGSGVFVFVTEQGNEITESLQKASQGKLNKPRRSTSKRRSQLNQRGSNYPAGHPPLSPSFSADTCSVASYQDSSVYADQNFVPDPGASTKVSSLETTTTIISDSSTSGSERLQLVDRDLVYQLYDFPPPVNSPQGQNNLNACKDASFLRSKFVASNAAIHRRYSCGDLNFNIKTNEWTERGKINGSLDLLLDNRRTVDISELDNLHATWVELNYNAVTPHREDKCLSEVARNIEALSPKLQKCESLKKLGSGSSGNSSSNSTQCLFESHGHSKDSQSTKMGDLLEEILKACEEFKGSSGSSTSNCSSTRDLTENTPSVSCDIGSVKRTGLKSPTSPTSPLSPTRSVGGSWEQSTMPSQCMLGSMYPQGEGCRCLSAGQCRSNVAHQRPSSASAANSSRQVCQSHGAQPTNKDNFDPLKPLEFKDLRKFDGTNDEGYLYWLRKVPGSNTPVCEPVRCAVYENIGVGRSISAECSPVKSCSSAKGSTPKPAVVTQSSSYPQGSSVMSYHASLRRPKAKGASTQYAVTANTQSSPQQSHSAGAYITLRGGNYDRVNLPQRQRGKSVEDLLADSPHWREPQVLPDQIPTTRAPPVPVSHARTASDPVYSMPTTTVTLPRATRDPEYMLMRPGAQHGQHQQDYMMMKPGSKQDSYMLMQPGARRDDPYMLMKPGAKQDDDVEGEIFCAVDLPPKRSDSGGSSRDMIRSRNCSFSSTSSTDPLCREDVVNYMEMSRGQSNRVFSRSVSVRDTMGQVRPQLNHSRSWDNELDVDYLQMNVGGGGNTGGNTDASGYLHMNLGGSDDAGSTNYMAMAPGRENCEDRPPVTAQSGSAPSGNKTWKPFDNLIEHQHHLNRVIDLPPRPPSAADRTPAENRAEEESNGKTTTNGKSPGLLSRLIRRGSTKDRKISKSQEDILAAPIDSVPEVPPPEGFRNSQSFSECPPRGRASVQFPRRHSTDLLEQKPDRQRSMSFPGRSWLEQGNLTDEQKQSCSSLLEAVPPPPSRAEFVPSTVAPTIPPALPPKVYNSQQRSSRGSLSTPSSRCSSQSRLSTAVASGSESLSDSTLSPLHISEDENNDEEEEQPPELPVKTTQLRNRGNLFDFRGVTPPSPSPLTMMSQPQESMYDTSAGVREARMLLPQSMSPAMARGRRVPPNLTVSIPSVCEEEDGGLWMGPASSQSSSIAPSNPMPKPEAGRVIGRLNSERAETLSVSSCSSSGATSICSDDHKTSSPAATTLRPRFGKEYQKVDRRRLAEELNVPLAEQAALQAASVASSSVFTFDVGSLSSFRSSPASAYSSGTDSPHSPSFSMRRYKDPDYVNISFPSESPRLTDTPPPGSPRSVISGMSDFSNSVLNYAEIDLSHSESSRNPRRPIHVRGRESATDYAMIDMVATAAASRVGKEHAQLREDSLRRKDSRSTSDGEYLRRSGKDRKGSTSSSGSKERKGISISRSSSSAKDRKFSGPV